MPRDTPPQDSPRRPRWQRFSPSMGWRAFWSEIVIVVVGVVLALGANEAVQDWSWRNKVAEAEVRLTGDLALVFVWAAEQRATQPCVEAQLVALTDRVLRSGDTLDPAPVHLIDADRYVVRLPRRPNFFPVWDALVADGTAARFSRDRQAMLGRISDSLALVRNSRQTETSLRLGGRLMVLGYPLALDANVRQQLLMDLEELRARNAADAASSGQRIDAIAEAGNAPADADVDAFLARSGTMQFCRAQGLPVGDWRVPRQLDSPDTAAPAP